MSGSIVFYHGWGFDAGFWRAIASELRDWSLHVVDRGYFGEARSDIPDAPCIALTHSFGTMLALSNPPPRCTGIVAINGFDRFVSKHGTPGVARRVLDRMISQFEQHPEGVLRDFRHRCGTDEPFSAIDTEALEQDLRALGSMDCSELSGSTGLPILSLQGSADPILPEAMRKAVFARCEMVERRTIPGGGHLLPLTEPETCARIIREFGMERA